jgi:hypothetical protein
MIITSVSKLKVASFLFFFNYTVFIEGFITTRKRVSFGKVGTHTAFYLYKFSRSKNMKFERPVNV